jgi:hypothetical protein
MNNRALAKLLIIDEVVYRQLDQTQAVRSLLAV